MNTSAMAVASATLVAEWELTGPLPPAISAADSSVPFSDARVLVRFASEPLGLVELSLPAPPAQLARVVWDQLHEAITQRLRSATGRSPDQLTEQGIPLRAG